MEPLEGSDARRVDGNTCSSSSPISYSGVSRLSKEEIELSYKELTGLDSITGVNLPSENRMNSFRNQVKAKSVTTNWMTQMIMSSEKVASQMLTEKPGLIFTCNLMEEGCGKEIAISFARKAFRRPLSVEQKSVVNSFFSAISPEESLKRAVTYILSSPLFLMKLRTANGVPGSKAQRLSANEMAERLSYLLWGTPPDASLQRLAENNKLKDQDILEKEVARMLADPKAIWLVNQFGEEWFQTWKLGEISPSKSIYPQFTTMMADYMRKETQLFLQHILLKDTPLDQFLTAKYSFTNSALNKHYGLADQGGSAFQKVIFNDESRQGILTQGSTLSITSNSIDSSVVSRGDWVMHNILCSSPPPPPPDVDVENFKTNIEGKTKRQIVEEHRQKAGCAGCHATMDAIGMGLENYDAVGAYRDTYVNGDEVDSFGEFADGTSFRSAEELILAVKAQDNFKKCVVEKTLTFALGRKLQSSDRCLVASLTKNIAADSATFKDLIVAYVQSIGFSHIGKGVIR